MSTSVAYLGPEGTFSHILARQRHGRQAPLVPCPSIDLVFEAVLENRVAEGLVPVENSSGGTVHDTIDQLIRHAGHLFILEEIPLDIRIALIGRSGEPVARVFSHFTQIKHHADWLRNRHPGVELVPVESTATAAQMAKGTPGSAALASPGAAEIYGLDRLATASRSHDVNVTNFFRIARSPSTDPQPDRTALAATLPNRCGSLHRLLGPFARQQVSLTRIVSRPVPGHPQTYVFYLEVEGGADRPGVAAALRAARRHAASLVSLGGFPLGRRFRS